MINYYINLNPHKNQYNVKLTFIPTDSHHILKLPTWIPGSYMVREFSKNINSFSIQQSSNNIKYSQVNKNTWEINNLDIGNEVEINYNVYAYDYGIRTAYLDHLRGYFNSTSLCLYVSGLEHVQHKIILENVPKTWQIATSLKKDSLNHYIASNYDELIDSPFELGELKTLSFIAANIQHYLILSGNILNYIDENKIINDLQKICEYQINMFGGVAPFTEYKFLLHLGGEIYTGLEHRSSTALMAPYYSLPIMGNSFDEKEYIKLLGLISHEYFHSWNVKRIKPKAFTPYDLENENYTSLLWWFEGVTSYYDDLVLYRTGIISQKNYLQLIIDNINNVYKYSGVNVQTLANSSLTSWIKYYRQDENSINSIVSYYIKGALVAMCLDLLIRQQSSNNKSLDNVLFELYKKWCQDQKGIAEDELFELIEQYSSCELSSDLHNFIYTSKPLPFKELFNEFGINVVDMDGAYSQNGKIYDSNEEMSIKPLLLDIGFRLNKEVVGYKIVNIFSNTIAEQSNLAPHDIIIAINNIKLDDWEKQFALLQKQDNIKLTIFRRNQLLEIHIDLCKLQKCQITNFKIIDNSLLSKWL